MNRSIELRWEGKRPPDTLAGATLTLCPVERFGEGANRLLLGDNLAAMAALRPELAGKFALIYLDPPFFSGFDWQASLKDAPRSAAPSVPLKALAFEDRWNNDLGAYLQWLFDRLAAARDLLSETGCLYLHLNWQAAHYAKLLLDEVFGAARFQNEIIWCYREAINSKKRWNRKHDTILFYSKGDAITFNYDAVREPYAESHIKKYRLRDDKGLYRLMGRGIKGSPLRSKRDLPIEYETRYPDLTFRHYLGSGTLPVDYWRIDIENQASKVRTGYPTQKPEALLERILLASSNPGDLIGDFCCGSGTSLAVAERLGRRWVGADCGELAIEITKKRLLQQTPTPSFRIETVRVEESRILR